MSKAFPNLVEISGKNIDEAGLRALGRLNGSCLSNVQFDRISRAGGSLLDKAIDAFCKGSPNLKKLCVTDFDSDYTPITDAAVKSVVKYCQQIEELSLKDWTDITNLSMNYLIQLSHLREIDLANCYKLTSGAVQDLLKANRKLEALVLSDIGANVDEARGTAFIGDSFLSCIGLHCPSLVKLHMRLDEETNLDITSASFEAMFKGIPMLEEFRLADYCKPNTILRMLGTYCPRLRYVYIENIDCCNDDGFAAMCRGCPLIESLMLHPYNLGNITDASMQVLATSCPLLSELHMSNNNDIANSSFCTLFTASIHLTSVEFYGLGTVTDKAILTLVMCCSRLRALTSWGCSRLTDYSILAVATHCPLLQSLSLEWIPSLTHETVVQVSRYCKQLRTLHLCSCDKVNNATVIEVLGNCKHLTKLNICSTNIKVTDELKAQCDQLASARHYRALRLKYKSFLPNSVNSY